jgi:hypothetical protein
MKKYPVSDIFANNPGFLQPRDIGIRDKDSSRGSKRRKETKRDFEDKAEKM